VRHPRADLRSYPVGHRRKRGVFPISTFADRAPTRLAAPLSSHRPESCSGPAAVAVRGQSSLCVDQSQSWSSLDSRRAVETESETAGQRMCFDMGHRSQTWADHPLKVEYGFKSRWDYQEKRRSEVLREAAKPSRFLLVPDLSRGRPATVIAGHPGPKRHRPIRSSLSPHEVDSLTGKRCRRHRDLHRPRLYRRRDSVEPQGTGAAPKASRFRT
jgi:hypothetical protein